MVAFRSSLLALLLLLLAAAVEGGRVKHVPLEREDDDFAEFDFDVEEEWDEGEETLISATLWTHEEKGGLLTYIQGLDYAQINNSHYYTKKVRPVRAS